ncbi:glycoside hydrolase family protein [Escherichia coli]|nr:glycoside hydrolase family protein [Escherichia coli]EGS3532894.1 glycoside hydrolase family protein [Escherichia coli]
MNEKIKYGLSAAVLALIGAGASAPEILDQFLDEKEGNHTTAYRDGAGIWTICRGAILVDGKPVIPGMKLSKEKCDRVNAIERDKALAWVEKNIKVPLTEPQKAGIASFCPYNIGPGTVREATGTSGVGNDAAVELSPVAGRNVLGIRDGIISDQAALRMLQEYIRTQCIN